MFTLFDFFHLFRSQTKQHLENVKELKTALTILKSEHALLTQRNAKLQSEINNMKRSSVSAPVSASASAPVSTSANAPVCVSVSASVNVPGSVSSIVNVPVSAIQKETPPFEYCIDTQAKLEAENLWDDDSFDDDFEEETILGLKSPNNKEGVIRSVEEEANEIRALWDEDEDSNDFFYGKMIL